MSANSDKIFSWIGKFSLIIGLIVGIITLYNIFNPKEPKIYARCNALSIPYTPFEDEFFKNNYDIKYNAYRSSVRYFMQCKIINDGDVEASKIRLVINDDILAVKSLPEADEIEYKKNKIEINSLRPQTSILLNIWADGRPPLSQQVQINSKEVSGTIEMGEVYYGTIASIAGFLSFFIKNFSVLFMSVGLSMFSTLCLIYVIFQIYKYLEQKEKDKQE